MKRYYLAALVAVLYIPLVTILGELFEPLKNFFKNNFWHHWLGKGVVLLAGFVILALVFAKIKDDQKDETYLTWIFGLALLGALAILAFFSFEYAKVL